MKKPVIIAAPENVDNLSNWKGAAILNLHITDADKYKDVLSKASKDVLVQLSTESFGAVASNELIDKVKAIKPQAVSVALRDFMPRPDYEIEAEEFFTWIKESGIVAQYILYNADEVRYFADLADQRIVPEGDDFVLFVLGKNQKAGKPYELDTYLTAMKETGLNLNWVVSAVGENEEECLAYALQKNGGISVSSPDILERLLAE